MKISLLFLLLTLSAFANPAWYYNLPNTKANTYIGYGSGKSESEAKQKALSDITSQISVNIDYTMKSSTKLQGDKFSQAVSEKSALQSSATLNGAETVKIEFLDSKYFVAMSYENIPSIDKFVREIKSRYSLEDEKQNSYIASSSINKNLKKALNKNINFKLLRKDKKWFIQYNESLEPLDDRDFSNFFTSVSNEDISITTNKKNNILYDKDQFYFKVNSTQNGYVTIFSVYEDGTVSTLVRNIKIKRDKLENIPDEEFETIPEAGLIKDGVETYDLYVVLYTPKKITLDSFAHANDSLIEDERYKNFDSLIEFLNDKTYATLKVVTRPR